MAVEVLEARDKRWSRHSVRDIVESLRRGVTLQSSGLTVGEVAATLGVSTRTYLRWRAEFGGLTPDQVYYIDQLEREISRLRKIVTNLESAERRLALAGVRGTKRRRLTLA